MTSISPELGFVNGNTYLRIGYAYFFNLTSNRAVCQFTSTISLTSVVTRIVSYDASYIYCFIPPAYQVDPALFPGGGAVQVRISSNNRDFSQESFTFTYLA
jgi:hypothetical protein